MKPLAPKDNKFHQGNGDDGKHYWLTPPELYGALDAEFSFTFDPCPYPLPDGFDGLTCEWGESNYVKDERKARLLGFAKPLRNMLRASLSFSSTRSTNGF